MRILTKLRLASLIVAILGAGATAQPLPTAFTYQGELKSGGTPATGLHDFRFRLYDAATGGSTLGMAPACVDNVAVTDGRFSARIDFGAAFAGQQRFLEIEVRQDNGADCTNTAGYTTLAPRVEVTAAPNAAFALKSANATQLNGQAASFYTNAANLTGTLPTSTLSGTYGGALTLSNASNSFSGSGAGLINLNAANLASGTVADARLSPNIPRLDAGNAFGNTINSFMGLVGIGTTNPGHLLHISGTFPSIAIQDADSTTQQVGYISFRDSANAEQAWLGYGSVGDPDFSILNARTGGDLVVRSFTGAVQLTSQAGDVKLTNGGNFGIGTVTPVAKLDVRGDIRLGPSGQFRAAAGEENLRIVRGKVTGSSINYGTGFTVTSDCASPGGGSVITFTTPFSGPPSVVFTPESGFPDVCTMIFQPGATSFSVSFAVFLRSDGSFTCAPVEFIAIGPR